MGTRGFVVLLIVGMMGGAAYGATIDLTTLGSSGTANGGIFEQFSPRSTGTGVIDSFLRTQANGTEKGYNTDGTLEWDTKTGIFTHSLLLSDVPTVTISGTVYREFLLDTNETGGGGSELTLDVLKFYVDASNTLTGYPGSFGPVAWDLDGVADNNILMDNNLNSGSGSGDMLAYIPSAAFGADETKYVYLYNEFGLNTPTDSGFEEWAVVEGGVRPPGDGSLMIVKFLDLDEDGVPDQGEPTLEGWDFHVVGANFNQIVTTGVNGTVTIDVDAGSYEITEINIPADWTITSTNPLTGVVVTEGQGTTVFFGNIPEPSTMAVLGIGGVLGLIRRRRRKA